MAPVPTIRLNNGVDSPQLGFGVFKIDPADTVAATRTALDVGYRHIDTAQMYGNEAEVGRAVRESGLDRGEIFVTSKLNNNRHAPDDALLAFDETLEALDLEYVDLFLVHWPLPGIDVDYVDTWRAMEKMYSGGRVRAIGVSNFHVEHLQRLLDEAEVVPAVNQIELHPRLQQSELREFHAEHGIVTEAWSPLAQGELLEEEEVIDELADSHGRTPAQVILRWHLQLGNAIIPKSATPERIESNIDILDGATLLMINDVDLLLSGRITNFGRVKLHGKGGIKAVPVGGSASTESASSPDGWNPFAAIGGALNNLGKFIVDRIAGGRKGSSKPPPPAPNPTPAPEIRTLQLAKLQNTGSLLIGNDGGGLIGNDGGGLIGDAGGTLIGDAGGTWIGNDGGGLVDRNGNRLVASGAGNLVAQGAGNLVAQGAGNLVAQGAGNLVATGGGNLVASGAGNLVSMPSAAARPAQTDGAEPESYGFFQDGGETDLSAFNIDGAVTLNGGVLSGNGIILGNLANNGGFIAPGNSPGAIAVTGSFSQGAGGTLVVEAAGGEARQIDQLQVGSTANLGGTLKVNTIDGYVPLPQDPFVPLGYAAVSGSFAQVSSNTTVAVTPTGVRSVLDPSATPAPVVLSSAVSRKTHNGLGPFDVNLPLNGVGVEPRRTNANGDHRVVLNFAEPVQSVGSVTLTSNSGSVTDATIAGTSVIVDLTGIANAQIINVSLTNVSNGAVSANFSVSMGVLLGDTTRDGTVNSGDALATRSRSGQVTDGTNFQFDVNSDGSINGGDATIVRARSGNTLYP